MTRKKVTEEQILWRDSILVSELLTEYGPDAQVSIDYWQDQLKVSWERDETDAEMNKRLAKAQRAREAAAKRKQKKEDADRALYEALKERFDK